jgi:hypothetical protein
MKEKLAGFSGQLLIVVLAGILLLLTIQMAKAQSVATGANANSQNALQGNNVITTKSPRQSLGDKIFERTTLSYYHMFLGPTFAGPTSETYNVFQEGTDQPNTGRAPVQSFQSALLRYDINQNWGVGASLAVSNGYGKEVVNQDRQGNVVNKPDNQFYNARFHLYLPAFDTKYAGLFSTFSYEAPTSVISRQDNMQFGLVLTENLTFKNPDLSSKWSGGITGQYYRMFYGHNNQKKVPGCHPEVCIPTQLQTQIITLSPYVNYRISDKWNWGNMAIFDWDQRGVQTLSREFNNNLPHRLRTTLSYYPGKWNITNVGLFAQPLMKFRPSTTAVGAEVALRF